MHDSELTEHPEGGRFKEVYRSRVSVAEGSRQRDALTHIYFSLNPDEVSRFHRVASDEVWNLYEGNGVILFIWDSTTQQLEKVELSRTRRDYCYIVKAGLWQAAMPVDGKILAGCSVAPGFEFADFELIDPHGQTGREILGRYPDLQHLVIGKNPC